MIVFATLMQYAISNPEYYQPWKKNYNELLDVKQFNDAELKDMIKSIASGEWDRE
jgi:hypothetical protein